MEDGTINISMLDPEEAREHLRHLSDLCSCPCTICVAICDRPEKVATCEAYQLWLWERMKHREAVE